MSMPVIDLNQIDHNALDEACEQWGFFMLRGHGINPTYKSHALQQMQQFFAQDTAVKNLIRRTETNCWGFYDTELTKNRRDWKEILDIGTAQAKGPLAGATPQWPDNAEFVETMSKLQQQLHDIALKITDAVLHNLGAELDLKKMFTEHTSFLRLNYYPPCPNPYSPDTHGEHTNAGELGISQHSDAGAVTVLLQDGHAGLQVAHNGQWIDVPPQPDALIINIGDIVQVWSNDLYPAPQHRVLANSQAARYSAPYFLNPGYEYDYAPLTQSEPHRYTSINWGEFRAARSAGDYADVGNEIQISDFKVDG